MGGTFPRCTVRYPRIGGLGRPADHRADAAGRRPGAPARGPRPAPHLRRVLSRVLPRDRRLGAASRGAHTGTTSPAPSSSCRWSSSPPVPSGTPAASSGPGATSRSAGITWATSMPRWASGWRSWCVLLSVWIVAAVIRSPNSRFTSLDAAVARSDILHSIDGVLPQAPSIFNDLQTFLNDQGFPQVFSTLTPPSTPAVSTPTERRDEGAGRSGRLLDGQDSRHGVQQRARGFGLRGRSGIGGHQRPRRGGREQRQHPGGAREQRVQRHTGAVRPRLRPGRTPDRRAAWSRPHHQREPGPPGDAGRDTRLSRGPGPDHRMPPV